MSKGEASTAISAGEKRERKQKLQRQLEVWRRELVALDRRQRLIYFKHLSVGSLEVAAPAANDLFKCLSRGPIVGLELSSSELQALEDDDAAGTYRQFVRSTFRASRKNPTQLKSSLTRLSNQSQQVYADRGYWTLYLGIGMLTWRESDGPDSVVSPILLCPVRLDRSGVQAPFTISRVEDEDVIVNPALRLKLEQDFAIELDDPDPDDPDITAYLAAVSRQVSEWADWKVEPRIVLTQFSFHKEAIYRDLADHESHVIDHPIVQQIALGAESARASSELSWDPDASDIDTVAPPEHMHTILDSDSSQRVCVVAARDGLSFVMDGPPGTGKSQTIANVIAELMAKGKSVLFVSEKAAALDVVRDRLASRGLGDFLLELHSHAATRKEVIHQLDRALKTRARVPASVSTADRELLARRRVELTDFADAMNEIRPGLDRSLIEVLGQLTTLKPDGGTALANVAAWKQLRAHELSEIGTLADSLSRAWRPVSEGDDFLWGRLASDTHPASKVSGIVNATRQAAAAAAAVVDRAHAIDADTEVTFSVSAADLSRRVRILEAFDAAPDVPSSWFGDGEIDRVTRRFGTLRGSCQAYVLASDELARRAGPQWAELDPDRVESIRAVATMSPADAIWPGGSEARVSEVIKVEHLLRETPVVLAQVLQDAQELAAILGLPSDGLTIGRATDIAALARMASSTTPPERDWLNPAVQSALDESARVLAELVEVVKQRQAAMRGVFNPNALQVDLEALNVRFKTVHLGMRKLGSSARADRKTLKSISVTGKAGKDVVASLDEAVAWQVAEQRLTSQEPTHAGRLGRYYRREDTEVQRLHAAVESARRIVSLAGGTADHRRLGDQLAADGAPDPRLLGHAERVTAALSEWKASASAVFSTNVMREIETSALTTVADWAVVESTALTSTLESLQHVADVTQFDPTLQDAFEFLTSAAEVAVAAAQIFNEFEADQELLGPLYVGVDSDWEAVNVALEWAERCKRLGGSDLDAEAAERFRSIAISPSVLNEPLLEWFRCRDSLTANFDDGRCASLRVDLDDNLRDAADLLSEMANSGSADIPVWDSFVHTLGELRAFGLDETLDALIARKAPREELRDELVWSGLQAWLEWTIGADPRLDGYAAEHRDAIVSDYRDMDHRLVDLAYIDVVNACSDRRPRNHRGAGAVMIAREAQKKSRHKPIREVLETASDIVQELKPCFMMSPLSVSQFLPGSVRFDVVIFDEASQVLPSDAVNCIYRGTQLIVAGDDKQLPPTSFFQASAGSTDEEAEDAPDEFESILTVCKSGVMPQLPLSWHYRSQHEHLITFSNYRFYAPADQPLQSFPGAAFEAEDLGVNTYFVGDGVYRRGAGRDNPIEAEKVIDRIEHHRRHHPHMSIGVVTLSSAQADAVMAALERRAREDGVLADLLTSTDRLSGFFVKSIENVQGDERDLIILSIGYGRDETGKVYNNFGAINTKSGWRRLNVAITRARRRVEVVTSLRAGDIANTENESVLHLQKYLAFAEHGPSALATELSDSGLDVESPFEADVLRVIESWGYDVVPQVGVAGYRIDLGIRHPLRPGEYVIGVECDGAAYHSARSARDRDRLRGDVLKGLGWTLHRIWGISWYRDRAGQSARLHEAIESAIFGGGEHNESVKRIAVEAEYEEFEPSGVPDWATEYSTYEGRPPYIAGELGSIEAVPALRKFLAEVIRIEAPVHIDLVHKRVRDAYAVGRIGSQIRKNIDTALSRLEVDGVRVRRGSDDVINLRDKLTVVRVPTAESNLRRVNELPRSELVEALVQTTRDAVSIDQDALFVTVARLFGWKRVGNDVNAALASALREARRQKLLELAGSGQLRVT